MKQETEKWDVTWHGRPVKSVIFCNGDQLGLDRSHSLFLSATYHGDRDEFWIVQMKGVREISRHNVRHIESIEWFPEGES